MKKGLISIILIGMVIILCLAGCEVKQNDENSETLNVDESSTDNDQSEDLYTYYSDFEGLDMEIVELNILQEPATMRVEWNNNTEHEIKHGNWFTIEYQDAGEWKSCATVNEEDATFEYRMQPGESKNKSYVFGNRFDTSKVGTYRIRTQCYVLISDKGDGTLKLCDVCAEFNID